MQCEGNALIENTLKSIYSEKATKFCKIFTLLLSYVVPVKSKVKISQNFLAFSEYIIFKKKKTLMNVYSLKFLAFSWNEWITRMFYK